MSLGYITKIANLAPKFGASGNYFFLKVQSDYGSNEYWLVTQPERDKFQSRSSKNTEDISHIRTGVFTVVINKNPVFGSDSSYFCLRLLNDEIWMLTAYDIERLRKRSESNSDDIETNKESWLNGLID